jgi:ribonuclease D
MSKPEITLHQGDLPAGLTFTGSIAVDTEAMGLNPYRDRLCLVQIGTAEGPIHLVQLNSNFSYTCPNLKAVLADTSLLKIFHFARFDVALLYHYLGVLVEPLYCTKVASKLTRNFTPRHGLKNLLSDVLGIEISKQAQASDWGGVDLRPDQLAYAATDVRYLHRLKEKLDELLVRENRVEMAQKCFSFLPTIAQLDLLGYEELNLFAHS